MIRWVRTFGLAGGLAFLIFGCEDPGIIGIDADPDNLTFSTNFESFSLPGKLVQRDSIFTSNTGTILVGKFEDLSFGKVWAQAYAQLSLTAIFIIPPNAVFDSLILQLQFAYVHGQDVSLQHEIEVHRLEEDLISDETYYTFSEHQFSNKIYGSKLFSYQIDNPVDDPGEPVVNLDTILTIRMLDSFGQEMFDKMADANDSTFLSNIAFQEYLKGFAFIPGAEYPTVSGFDIFNENTKMSLYFSFEESSAKADFTFGSGPHYHGISFDRTGTNVASVSDQLYTETDADDGLIYVQSLTGLMAKIDMSSVVDWSKALKADSNSFLIHNATLTLGRVEPFAPNRVPPDEIAFYYTDSTNRLLIDEETGVLRTIQEDNPFFDPTGVLVPASFEFKVDEDNVILSYSDRITSYIQALFDETVTASQILVQPVPKSNSVTFDRFRVNPANINLDVYYTIIKKER